MSRDRTIEKSISAREALFRVGSVGAVGLGLGAVHLVTGFGVPCPFRAVTGWLCPFCGGTHVAEALIRGDVAGAWVANPLLLAVAALVAVRAVGWAVELVRDPGRPSRLWLPASWRRHWFAAFMVVSVGYVLVRNLFALG
jgi:hypothetical protein